MRVQLGFSGEFSHNQWKNGKVDVDEVDLQRTLNDEGIDLDPTKVPRKLAFVIMEAEATVLVYTEIKGYGGDAEECATRIKDAVGRQQEALDRLRTLAG